MSEQETGGQWERHIALCEKMEGRMPGIGDEEADRYSDASAYAASVETAETTDEQWAEAFWNAWIDWTPRS